MLRRNFLFGAIGAAVGAVLPWRKAKAHPVDIGDKPVRGTKPHGYEIDQKNGIVKFKGDDVIFDVNGKLYRFRLYRLDAVGQDLDGTVKPIDQLSYTPKTGWQNAGYVNGCYAFGCTDGFVAPEKSC